MKEANKAHMLLDYLLSYAVLNQELKETTLLLDYMSLCTECEDVFAIPEEANNIKLKLKISLEWDLEEETYDLNELLKGDDEDELDDREFTDSDKKSH
jgi:hypothetical protein